MLSGRWLRRQQKQWLLSARLADLFLISAVATLDSSATLEFPDRRCVEVAGRVIRNGDGDPGVDPFALRVGLDEVETSD